MIHNHRFGTRVWWLVPLLAAALACAVPGQTSGGGPSLPIGGGTEAPTATAVYVGTAGEGDPIDLCALPTPEEVQTVLGGPATSAVYYDYGQNCTLFLDETHILIVQAGHDPDGKALHLGGLAGIRYEITDQAMLQLLDQLNADAANLTLPELVEQALPIWRAAGFTAEVEPGIGDWAVWFVGYEELGTLAQLGAGRASGAWVSVYTTASDVDSARALLRPLAAALLDRLPDNFTPTGNGY